MLLLHHQCPSLGLSLLCWLYLIITGPVFHKLARMMLLGVIEEYKDLKAESEPLASNAGRG